MVTKPRPPTWIKSRITSCPNRDQWVYVSKRISPVTHAADVAVKNESDRGVIAPSAEANGRHSSMVPIKMTVQYPTTKIRTGDDLIIPCFNFDPP